MAQEQTAPDELMETATEALGRGDLEEALSTLKRLQAVAPEDAMATYLLATVHAGMGMMDRAVEEYVAVLEQEPDFHVARFQLGLIFLGAEQGDDALMTWEPFAALGEDDCFFLFRRGMEHFLAGRYSQSASDLEASIASNDSYESVMDDLVNIFQEIKALATQ